MNYKEFIVRADDLTRKVIEITHEIFVTFDNVVIPNKGLVNVNEVSMSDALLEIRARIIASFYLFNDFARFMAVDVDDKITDADSITHFESYLSDITLVVNKFLDTSREVVSFITDTYCKRPVQVAEEERISSYENKLETIVNGLNSVLDNLYEIKYFLSATETLIDSDCDVTEKETLVDLTPNVDDSNIKTSGELIGLDAGSTINLTE